MRSNLHRSQNSAATAQRSKACPAVYLAQPEYCWGSKGHDFETGFVARDIHHGLVEASPKAFPQNARGNPPQICRSEQSQIVPRLP
jgi:hypothetical protein